MLAEKFQSALASETDPVVLVQTKFCLWWVRSAPGAVHVLEGPAGKACTEQKRSLSLCKLREKLFSEDLISMCSGHQHMGLAEV